MIIEKSSFYSRSVKCIFVDHKTISQFDFFSFSLLEKDGCGEGGGIGIIPCTGVVLLKQNETVFDL